MQQEFNKIFNLLSEVEFQNPGTGLLFFPVYIYTYDPQKEYIVREKILELDANLQRPSNNLNSLLINIFDEFINFLKEQIFAKKSLFENISNMEKSDYKATEIYLIELAQSERFFEYLGDKISKYFQEKETDKVYLLIHGFGSIFPYLRVSHFLKNTERFIKFFKLIVFYPGEFTEDNYSLFNHFNDDNVYRANHLNQYLENNLIK